MRQYAIRDGAVAAKHQLLGAMTMQGCPGEEWALKAYAAYKDCLGDGATEDLSNCCKTTGKNQTD
jgi:hypothetical protein